MIIAMRVEYSGFRYRGWQQQASALNIQGRLQQAIAFVANESIELVCAGRTDAGVHASGQVVHFETQADRSERAWVLGVNTRLPEDIRVLSAARMPADFHARFSAVAREYVYWLYNADVKPGIFHQHVAWHYPPLQLAPMQAAAQLLLGEHDFSSFRAVDCQSKSPIRRIEHIAISQFDRQFQFRIKANAFLYHMVRNIVGTLFDIGEGKQPVGWMQSVLAAKDRTQAGITAPAGGLYLQQVYYPEPFESAIGRKNTVYSLSI